MRDSKVKAACGRSEIKNYEEYKNLHDNDF